MKIWDTVGIYIKNWYTEKRGKDMLYIAFSIWSVLIQALADDKEPMLALGPSDPPPHEGTPSLLSHSGPKKEAAKCYNPD